MKTSLRLALTTAAAIVLPTLAACADDGPTEVELNGVPGLVETLNEGCSELDDGDSLRACIDLYNGAADAMRDEMLSHIGTPQVGNTGGRRAVVAQVNQDAVEEAKALPICGVLFEGINYDGIDEANPTATINATTRAIDGCSHVLSNTFRQARRIMPPDAQQQMGGYIQAMAQMSQCVYTKTTSEDAEDLTCVEYPRGFDPAGAN